MGNRYFRRNIIAQVLTRVGCVRYGKQRDMLFAKQKQNSEVCGITSSHSRINS